MENPVIECIKERRSIRDYTDEPLSRELIEEIIMAGRYAPSAENSQPWKFIVITSRDEIASLSGEVKRQIREVLRHKRKWKKKYPELARQETALFLNAISSSEKDNIFFNAPVVVFIVTEDKAFYDESCACAAQNMMLAAWSLGIGSCWIGFAKFLELNPALMEKIGVPEGHHISACIILGHAAHVPKPQIRKPMADIIRWIE
ncbi:MAG: nitroreductase family protein [Thermoplasmata archaeon]|nr:MAG: nitroreductase family protein [Thermoplasmata archaeon]